MSSDPLEKNLGDLIRHGALPLDGSRSSRARDRFLDGIAAPPDRISWKIAAAAAAVLVVVTMVWSARKPPAVDRPVAETAPAGPLDVVGHGGDKNLQGSLRRIEDRLRFEGRSPLPDGTLFHIRVERLEIQEHDRILRSDVSRSFPISVTLLLGAIDCDWPHKNPGKLRLVVNALEDLQDMKITKQLKEKGISAGDLQWTFEYYAWDEKLLGQLGPQLEAVTTLAEEVRDLVGRVSQACEAQATFESQKKPLIKEAERLQARADGMAASGLFPEASRRIAYTAGDLAQAMTIFTWKESKFDGARSYYTNGDKSRTHRGEPFEFAALRKYLDEAAVVGGREFGLWIAAEFGRAGPKPELAETVKPYQRRPGMTDVADRLMKLVHEFHGVDLEKLDQDLRRIP